MQEKDEIGCCAMRERVLEAAREAFMRDGYRTSMDAIAAQAGVAKQTLYNHFPNKAALFGATACAASAVIVVSLAGSGELRDALLAFGRSFRQRALGEEGLAMFRVVTGEGRRFPEMNQSFFDSGPRRTVAGLSEFLARAMTEGKLRQDDPQFAAEMLVGMLLGLDHARRLCLTALPEEPEEQRLARIVDCFLRAFVAH